MNLGFIDNGIIRSLWGCSFVGWVYLAFLGASGDVLLMWGNNRVKLVEECVGIFSVACSFKNIENVWKWAFAEVYGPKLDRDRSFLWKELASLYSLWDLPCACAAISTFSGFQVSILEILVCLHLWRTFMSLCLI